VYKYKVMESKQMFNLFIQGSIQLCCQNRLLKWLKYNLDMIIRFRTLCWIWMEQKQLPAEHLVMLAMLQVLRTAP
jgi:hypothetical protein